MRFYLQNQTFLGNACKTSVCSPSIAGILCCICTVHKTNQAGKGRALCNEGGWHQYSCYFLCTCKVLSTPGGEQELCLSAKVNEHCPSRLEVIPLPVLLCFLERLWNHGAREIGKKANQKGESWTAQHRTTSGNPVLHLPLWIRKTWDLMRQLKSPWLDNKWGSTWDLETVAYFWPLMDLVLICGFCLDLHWQSKLAAPQSIFKISEMVFPYHCLLL